MWIWRAHSRWGVGVVKAGILASGAAMLEGKSGLGLFVFGLGWDGDGAALEEGFYEMG